MPDSLTKLYDEVSHYIRAGFPAIWIESIEASDAADRILSCLAKGSTRLISYDIASGFHCTSSLRTLPAISEAQVPNSEASTFDSRPTELLKAVPKIKSQLRVSLQDSAEENKDPYLVVVIKNAHLDPLLGKSLVHVQLVQNLCQLAKTEKFVFIFTGNLSEVHRDLKHYITVVAEELPDVGELEKCARSLEFDAMPAAEAITAAADAAKGLTLGQAQNAFALSYIKLGKLDPAAVWSLKAQELHKSGLLEICSDPTTFDDIGGSQGLKAYATDVLAKKHQNPRARPKSILLLGVPGSGKSASVQALGNETGRNVLRMDMNSLRNKYQGESENNVRRALQVADSMEPCILFIDEINTVFAGSNSSDGDSGTSMRIFGSWLTWLNDHTTDVLVVGTANDVSSFPPAFTRAERFDGTFFFDLPSLNERRSIWQIYLRMFFGDPNQFSADELAELVDKSELWTGAEIRACCRHACMRGLKPVAAMGLIPVYAKRNQADLKRLRDYALTNQCWSVSEPNQLYNLPVSAISKTLPAPGAVRSLRKLAAGGDANN